MNIACVYWIRKKHHNDCKSEGYIGVARNVQKRFNRHVKQALNKNHKNKNLILHLFDNDIVVETLFVGDETECYLKEFQLRPNYRIGWNVVPGGHGGSTSLGKKHTEEFKKRRSECMKGNKIAVGNNKPKTDEHKRKISFSLKGRIISDEQKLKQSLKMKGRKQSPESNEKRRLSSLGKKRGPYKKTYDMEI